jgi:hypothetical protein
MPTETRYFTSTTTTVNGLSGYSLGKTQSTTSKYISASVSGYVSSADFYVRVGKVSPGNIQTIILDWTLHSTVLEGSLGYFSTNLTIPTANLSSSDAIFVDVKIVIGSASTTGTWVTEVLNATQVSETWTFTLYLYCLYYDEGNTTIARFYFGSTTYNSRILNFTWSAYITVSNFLSSLYKVWQIVSGYSDTSSFAKIEATDFKDYVSKLKLSSIIWYKKLVEPSYGTVGYTTVTLETIFADTQAPDPRQISVVFNLRSELDPNTTLSTTVPVYSLATKVFRAIGSIPISENVPLNCYDLQIEVNYLVS